VAHALFHLGISAGEKSIRTVAVYAAILVLLHLSGKRQLAGLNSFDLVVLMLLSNVVQNAIIGNDLSLTGGLLGALILIVVNYAVVRLAFMSPRFGKTIQGGPTTLLEDGKIDRRALRRQAITHEQLVAGLRREGFELDEVERVVLEPEGVFNADPKQPQKIDEVLAALKRIEAKLA
jgi:uncharacterized membrane protein YcaP (DUF421 family)